MSVPTIEGLIGIYTPFLGFKSAGIQGLSVRVGALSSDSPCKTQTLPSVNSNMIRRFHRSSLRGRFKPNVPLAGCS